MRAYRKTTALLVLASGLLLHCTSERVDGTRTNWLRVCGSDADCDSGITCRCGLCTLPCEDDSSCQGDICGSKLASIDRCGDSTAARICLPAEGFGGASSNCTSVALVHDGTSPVAIEPNCTASGALLCESFDAPLPEGYSPRLTSPMTATIQDCLAFSGGALRCSSDAAGSLQTLMRLSSPVESGPLFIRFYTYVASGAPVTSYLHFLELWSDASNAKELSFQAIGNETLELYLGSTNAYYSGSPNSLLRDEWMCVEISLNLDGTLGTAEVALNGTPLVAQTNLATLPASPITQVVLGAHLSGSEMGADVVFDELVVATSPVGCLASKL